MKDPHKIPQGGEWLPHLARRAVTDHFRGACPEGTPVTEGYLAGQAGVFVTIRSRDGQLRGCRGTMEAQHGDLMEETRAVALTSALQDDRFNPVTAEELDQIVFEVSVLHSMESIPSPAMLDPAIHGVVVQTVDGRRAVMLPGVEGLDTPEQQVEATRRKACIFPGEPVILKRFQVDTFKETAGIPETHVIP